MDAIQNILLVTTTALLSAVFGAVWNRRGLVQFRQAMSSQLGNTIATRLGQTIAAQLKLSNGIQSVGLDCVVPESDKFDYTNLLENNQRVVILLNDGRTWLSVHRTRLAKRLADPNKETTVFLIRPGSPMVEVLAKKGNISSEALTQRIRESIALLLEIRGPRSNLEILGHSLFNPHSVVLGDDNAAVVPYFASRGGRNVPLFHFTDSGDESYFRHLREDLERLRKDAVNISELSRTPDDHSQVIPFPVMNGEFNGDSDFGKGGTHGHRPASA